MNPIPVLLFALLVLLVVTLWTTVEQRNAKALLRDAIAQRDAMQASALASAESASEWMAHAQWYVMPEGAVCKEMKFYTKHWRDGARECQRCGAVDPRAKDAPLPIVEVVEEPLGHEPDYSRSALYNMATITTPTGTTGNLIVDLVDMSDTPVRLARP